MESRVKGLGWDLQVSEAARSAISELGFDPQYGARPLKRVIQQRVENALAQEILKVNDDKTEKSISVDFDGTEFVFTSA